MDTKNDIEDALLIEWYGGRATIYLDEFFPTSKKRIGDLFRKILVISYAPLEENVMRIADRLEKRIREGDEKSEALRKNQDYLLELYKRKEKKWK